MIQPASSADLPWLRFLFDAFVKEQIATTGSIYPRYDADELDRFTLAVHRHLQANPDLAILLAWYRKKAIGFIAGEVVRRPVGQPAQYLNGQWLYVDPRFRQRHLAQRLLDELMAWGLSKGCDTIEWHALGKDDSWARRGYTPIGTVYACPIVDGMTRGRALVSGNGKVEAVADE